MASRRWALQHYQPKYPKKIRVAPLRLRIVRLVLRIGAACTLHRRHAYPTSPHRVLCIAFRVADAKNNH